MASNYNNGTAASGSPTPMTDADVTATADFEPAMPLKDTGVAFESDRVDAPTEHATPTQAIREGASKVTAKAGDQVRTFAEQGKTRASGALDQLVQTLTDAAATIDEKVGPQYGQYARSAADQVSGIADRVKAKDVDALFDDARAFVKKSPAVALGGAAAIGFVLARLVSSGIDNKDA